MHPFDYVRSHDVGDTFALLYSGMQSQGSGEKSLLAYASKAEIKGGKLDDLCQGTWFGYGGYEMLHTLEDVPRGAPPPIVMPDQWWFLPSKVVSFPREDSVQSAIANSHNDCHPAGGDSRSAGSIKVTELHSNLSTQRYLDIVRETISQIRAGAFYQANITRKFYGRFDKAPDSFALFERLCALSPSPYSAYLQFGECAILSSSPEGFLQIGEDGKVTARPIKGSGVRGDETLARSDKNRAENLMIVDLMRNDLSRSCCDIRVEALHEIHDFATIRQMISTVSGQRQATVLDVIQGCFPPGSMTGAPKVAAMRWIASQEQMQRGVYSGALGWIDTAKQSADLSVVIRTLILQGDRFEFQVGGGIVADSVPELELEETLLKARAICALLGVDTQSLKAL